MITSERMKGLNPYVPGEQPKDRVYVKLNANENPYAPCPQVQQAVIDFVNNDVECRSVQLLRYFNEKTSKTCGKCDVCLKKQSATKDVVQIETKITNDLNNGPMTIREVLKNNSDRSEDEILEAIRWLVDNGVLSIDKDERLYKK